MNQNLFFQFQGNRLRSTSGLPLLFVAGLVCLFTAGLVVGQRSVNWSGTYTNAAGTSTLTLSGSGTSLSATEQWRSGDRHGTGAWSNCKVNGNAASCDWTGTYEGDPAKSGTRHGTLSVTLDGNRLSGSSLEDTPDFREPSGKQFDSSYSSMHKGAVWSIDYTRKGGPPPEPNEPVVTGKPIANVGGLRGDVSVRSPGGSFEDLTPGRQLREGDDVATGPDSNVTLKFSDGSTVVLRPDTQCNIGSLLRQRGDIKVRVNLIIGAVEAKISKSETATPSFGIRTPNAVSSVRGTVFNVRYDEPTQTTTVAVEEGVVEVASNNSSSRAVSVSAGQQVQVAQDRVGEVTGTGGSVGGRARSSCFANDPGAVVTAREAHMRWAQGRDAKELAANLQTKFEELYACPAMSDEQLAKVFGDISVIVATYVPDAACFGGDVGVASTDAAAHQRWARQAGRGRSRENLKRKAANVFDCLERSRHYQYFAYVSIAIAQATKAR